MSGQGAHGFYQRETTSATSKEHLGTVAGEQCREMAEGKGRRVESEKR